MKRNYIALDVEDPRSSLIAEVLANKSCRKILGLLTERELSESELSSQLAIPLTTVGYNVKKLIAAGLIEKKRSFWSSRGKVVPTYKVSNKSIVISPRKLSGNTLPALIVSALAAIGLYYHQTRTYVEFVAQPLVQSVADASKTASSGLSEGAAAIMSTNITSTTVAAPVVPVGPAITQSASLSGDIALWFFLGALTFLVAYLIIGKLRYVSLK